MVTWCEENAIGCSSCLGSVLSRDLASYICSGMCLVVAKKRFCRLRYDRHPLAMVTDHHVAAAGHEALRAHAGVAAQHVAPGAPEARAPQQCQPADGALWLPVSA